MKAGLEVVAKTQAPANKAFAEAAAKHIQKNNENVGLQDMKRLYLATRELPRGQYNKAMESYLEGKSLNEYHNNEFVQDSDEGLQRSVVDALDRTGKLDKALKAPTLRTWVRQKMPGTLAPFDPVENPDDMEEMSHLVSKSQFFRSSPPKADVDAVEKFYDSARKTLGKKGMDEKELSAMNGYYLISHYDQLYRDAK